MTEPRPANCTSPCIACMTDESHDPIPAPLSPCRRIDRHNSHLHEVYRRPFLCPGVTERAEKETARHGAARAAILRDAQAAGRSLAIRGGDVASSLDRVDSWYAGLGL